MPIYEYRCGACTHEFETMQKVGARPLRKCPDCGGKLEKLFSRTSFHLKGGGWYAQGYNKSARGSSKSKTSDAKGDSAKKSAGKSPGGSKTGSSSSS